jgi:hypothetical protein
MEEITYKYFVAEGANVAAVMAEARAQNTAHQERIRSLLKKYEADCVWGNNYSAPSAIGFIVERTPDGTFIKPPVRENFLKPKIERSGAVKYACYRPDRRYKAGKAIKDELSAIGAFNYSSYISKKLRVDRMVFGFLDGRQVACSTTAGRYGDILVFRIPVGGDDKAEFAAPDGFREIKKSEFVAITEEATE